jgi:hypothetical protein
MNKLKFLFYFVFLILISCHQKKDTFFSYIKGEMGISGVVTRNGAPMEDVEVYLYRNIKSNLRGPADFMDLTDEKGEYFIDVPEGAYYIVARKRKSGVKSGPIKKGDYYSDPIYEPAIVVTDKTTKVDLTLKQLFGSLIQKESGQKKTGTFVSGTIMEEKGTPLKGVYAFAYKNKDFMREPDYFSTETDADGRYTIYFEEGGKYYLGARSSGRGIPKPGELYGLYEGVRGNGIFIKDDEEVTGIKITIKEYR